MSGLISSVTQLTFVHALLAAVAMVVAAMLVFKGGMLNGLLWLGALVLVIIGVVNYVGSRGQG